MEDHQVPLGRHAGSGLSYHLDNVLSHSTRRVIIQPDIKTVLLVERLA